MRATGGAIYGMGAALIVGLLVGLERERGAKGERAPEREPAGIRYRPRAARPFGRRRRHPFLLGVVVTAAAGLAVGTRMLSVSSTAG